MHALTSLHAIFVAILPIRGRFFTINRAKTAQWQVRRGAAWRFSVSGENKTRAAAPEASGLRRGGGGRAQ